MIMTIIITELAVYQTPPEKNTIIEKYQFIQSLRNNGEIEINPIWLKVVIVKMKKISICRSCDQIKPFLIIYHLYNLSLSLYHEHLYRCIYTSQDQDSRFKKESPQ